jgi:hypothetical protein
VGGWIRKNKDLVHATWCDFQKIRLFSHNFFFTRGVKQKKSHHANVFIPPAFCANCFLTPTILFFETYQFSFTPNNFFIHTSKCYSR